MPNKIQLGPHLTQGLGAGANPAIGRQATEESLEEIKRILEVNTKMAFITAGMGGGTGTGGAPILAKICKDLGILTVGIVTTPFAYEGKKRIAQAEEGIMILKNHVDTLLVISNDKLRHQFGNLKMKEAFAKADNVLATAAKCITDVINSTGQINVDFADVCTVMSNGGVAILGSAAAEGENRAQKAIENALNSPLLNDNDIRGAKWILININSAEGEHEFTMDEVEMIQNYLLSQAGEDTDVILGLGYDSTLGEKIGITLIATGFEHKDPFDKKSNDVVEEKQPEKIVMTLAIPEEEKKTVIKEKPVQLSFENTAPAVEEPKSREATAVEEIPDAVDAMKPILSEVHPPAPIQEPAKEQNPAADFENSPVYYSIKASEEEQPEEKPKAVQSEQKEISAQNNFRQAVDNGKAQTSGGYLSRPSQIYVEETSPTAPEPMAEKVVNESTIQLDIPEQEAEQEMKLVMKEEHAAETKEAEGNQASGTEPVQEDLLKADDAEELKRRAVERINKLRNLSFNVNSADPNNEFETVPAYLRRNMELHNSIADVESFYSNYTVKSTPNNQADIGTINTFLEGKKPD